MPVRGVSPDARARLSRRRAPAIAAACAVAGGLCVGFSARAVSEPTAATAGPESALATAVWSPRRAPAVFGAAVADARLRREVSAVAARFASCALVHREGDAVAFVEPARALAGASTQKLLVAAATLATAGPEHRFETRAVTTAALRDGELAGDLTIVGSGDPVLTTATTPSIAADPRTPLAALADAIAQAGIRGISGALVADDSRFDRARAVPDWEPSYITGGEVGALGALIVNGGRGGDGLADPEPALTTVRELATLLAARGVRIAGGANDPGRAASPNARVVAHIESPPVREIVGEMLATSNNETAELLTREIGFVQTGAGTTSAGTRAIPAVIGPLGVRTEGVELHDGSGLSPDNRVTCVALSDVVALSGRPGFATLLGGLAIAGRTGTLASRYAGSTLAGRLRAKTGRISGVVGLAGVVEPRPAGTDRRAQAPTSRSRARFAFVANGDFSTATGERLQDQIAASVAAYVDEPSAPDPIPPPR